MPTPPETGPAAAARSLVRRDRAVPGLDLALDDAALSAWMAPRWVGPGSFLGARVTYVRYKPGTSVIAAVVVHTTGGTVPALGRFVATGGLGKLEKLMRAAERTPGPFAPVVDVDRAVAIGPVGADRALPGVATLLAPGATAHRILRYNPERRLVVRVGTGRATRLVKAYQGGEAGAMAAHHRAVASSGLAVPPLLEVDHQAALVVTGWIDGVSLDAGTTGPGDIAACGALAARLHRADVADLPTAPGLTAVLADAVGAITTLVPDAADAADAVACGVLDAMARAAPVAPTPVHGDLSADQVLRTPGGDLVVVDLDRASLDDPAIDLASFVAASLVASLAASLTGGRPDVDVDAGALAAALVDGHSAAGGPDVTGRLAPRTAAAVLQRAAEPFRYRRPGWDEGVRQLVAAAGIALDAEVPA